MSKQAENMRIATSKGREDYYYRERKETGVSKDGGAQDGPTP